MNRSDVPPGYGYRPARSPLATIVWWASIDTDGSYTDAAATSSGDCRSGCSEMTPRRLPWSVLLPALGRWNYLPDRCTGVSGGTARVPAGIDVKPVDEFRELETGGDWFLLGVPASPSPGPRRPRTPRRLFVAGCARRRTTRRTRSGRQVRSRCRTDGAEDDDGDGGSPQERRADPAGRTAYRLLHAGLSAAEAATRAGYTDQSHMTRDFRLFAGDTPGRILRGDGASPFDSRMWPILPIRDGGGGDSGVTR